MCVGWMDGWMDVSVGCCAKILDYGWIDLLFTSPSLTPSLQDDIPIAHNAFVKIPEAFLERTNAGRCHLCFLGRRPPRCRVRGQARIP
jgi:hypothetical protein